MAKIRARQEKDTFDRQMSAIIAKFLTDLEDMPAMREIHPMDFDKVRRRGIDAAWECFLVGRKRGLQEARDADIDTTQPRAVNS